LDSGGIVLKDLDNELELEDSLVSESNNKKATRSIWVSAFVNLCLSIVQIVVGIFSHSQGLVADGIHSLSDLGADFVALVATWKSKQKADDNYHYGYKRYENLASLILGVLLLVVGVGMLWSAVQKLENPESIPTVQTVALWVALCALVAKELLFRYMLAVAKLVKSSMLIANAWHARSDAASSLIVAIGIIGNISGLPILDPIAALIVGFVVGKMGWTFMWDATQDLLDKSVSEEEVIAIGNEIRQTQGVLGFHELKTRKSGDMILADVHLELDASMTVAEGHEIANKVKANVMTKYQVLYIMIHVDPVYIDKA
jgi:cation diffusion facilitator family transporter